MTACIRPANSAALADAVRRCVEARETMHVRGAGSSGWQGLADAVIDMSGHRGVTHDDPEELVVTLRSGTPLAELEALLDERQQMLAFDPVDPGLIRNGHAAGTTIGGVVATGNSGPRRVTAGAARDHVLGFAAVTGRGEAFKAGGRVVKNVTGFDLAKLFTASWGTLGVFDTVTLRVLPAPRFEATLVVRSRCGGLADMMSRAMRHPAGVTCAAWDGEHILLRLEGFRPSVDARIDAVAREIGCGRLERADETYSAALWRSVAHVAPLAKKPTLWRLSLAPAAGTTFAERMGGEGLACMVDWAGARVWVGAEDDDGSAAAAVSRTAATLGGYARLMRGSAPDPVPPADQVTATMSSRVRDAFDPYRLFNPGLDPWER